MCTAAARAVWLQQKKDQWSEKDKCVNAHILPVGPQSPTSSSWSLPSPSGYTDVRSVLPSFQLPFPLWHDSLQWVSQFFLLPEAAAARLVRVELACCCLMQSLYFGGPEWAGEEARGHTQQCAEGQTENSRVWRKPLHRCPVYSPKPRAQSCYSYSFFFLPHLTGFRWANGTLGIKPGTATCQVRGPTRCTFSGPTFLSLLC